MSGFPARRGEETSAWWQALDPPECAPQQNAGAMVSICPQASRLTVPTSTRNRMRFQRIVPALDAVLVNAGVALCGVALLGESYRTGGIALPFPLATATRTQHAFHAHYRADTAARRHITRFREWLAQESAAKERWLDGPVGG